MTAKFLWIIGSTILITLGVIHAFLTFCTNKFSPKNSDVEEAMKITKPLLSDHLTMWNAWIGFNASHSFGIIFIGCINLYVAINYFKLLETDRTIPIFSIITVALYILLASKYWFNSPLIGLSLTLLCFIASYILMVYK